MSNKTYDDVDRMQETIMTAEGISDHNKELVEEFAEGIEAVIERLGLGVYRYDSEVTGEFQQVREPDTSALCEKDSSHPDIRAPAMKLSYRLADIVRFRHQVRQYLSAPVSRSEFSLTMTGDPAVSDAWRYTFRPAMGIACCLSPHPNRLVSLRITGTPDTTGLDDDDLESSYMRATKKKAAPFGSAAKAQPSARYSSRWRPSTGSTTKLTMKTRTMCRACVSGR